MNNILGTMSFLGCSLAVLGSPALEASNMSASVVTSTRYEVNKEGALYLASCGLEKLDESALKKEDVPKIKWLSLEDNKLTPETLGVLSDMTNLKELTLSKNLMTSGAFGVLSALTHLEDLILNENAISTLNGFPRLQCLKWLELRGNRISTLNGFPELQKLEVLDLSENQLTSEGLGHFPNLPNLKTLYLRENGAIEKDDIIKLATRFPTCTICGSDVTMYAVENVGGMVGLGRRNIALLDPTKLPDLSKADSLTSSDRELKSLVELEKFSLHNLKGLTITNSGITTLDPTSIRSWPNLEHLSIRHSKLEKVDVSCLSDLKKLKSLNLSENENLTTLTGLDELTNLTSLSFGDTPIDPTTVYRQLTKLSKLEELNLCNTTVDTKLLVEVLDGRQAVRLRVQGCLKNGGQKISRDEIKELSEKLSKCYIYSDYGLYVNGLHI